jgi:hypothetical protein
MEIISNKKRKKRKKRKIKIIRLKKSKSIYRGNKNKDMKR